MDLTSVLLRSMFVLRRWRTDAGSPVGVATWHALSANETANHEYQAYTGRSNRQRLLAFPRIAFPNAFSGGLSVLEQERRDPKAVALAEDHHFCICRRLGRWRHRGGRHPHYGSRRIRT